VSWLMTCCGGIAFFLLLLCSVSLFFFLGFSKSFTLKQKRIAPTRERLTCPIEFNQKHTARIENAIFFFFFFFFFDFFFFFCGQGQPKFCNQRKIIISYLLLNLHPLWFVVLCHSWFSRSRLQQPRQKKKQKKKSAIHIAEQIIVGIKSTTSRLTWPCPSNCQ
jgi:hypothetical protein